MRLDSAHGIVSDLQWVRAIIEVADGMRRKKWSDAFVGNGYSIGQMGIRARILDKLQLTSLSLPVGRPDEDHVAFLLPSNKKINVRLLLDLVGTSKSKRKSPSPPQSWRQVAARALSLD